MTQEQLDRIEQIEQALEETRKEASAKIKNLEQKLHFIINLCDHKTPAGTTGFTDAIQYVNGEPVNKCYICGVTEEYAKWYASTRVDDLEGSSLNVAIETLDNTL